MRTGVFGGADVVPAQGVVTGGMMGSSGGDRALRAQDYGNLLGSTAGSWTLGQPVRDIR